MSERVGHGSGIRVGDAIEGLGRVAAEYLVSNVDGRGFTMLRTSGKHVRVTWRMVDETAGRLLQGEDILFQGNRSIGGIDGTSAIRDGVLAALSGFATRDGKKVVRLCLACGIALEGGVCGCQV